MNERELVDAFGDLEGDEEGDNTEDDAAARLAEEAEESADGEQENASEDATAGAAEAASDVASAAEEIDKKIKAQDATNTASELINEFERVGREVGDGFVKKLSPEAFLNKTERLLLKELHNAVESGDLKSVQQMLAALAENPKSVNAVMGALKARLEGSNHLNHVRWESGRDSDGNAFVRLHISQNNDSSKSSGATSVMIGSDGTHTARHTERWNSQPETMDPSNALHQITVGRWMRERLRDLPPNESGQLRPSGEKDRGRPNPSAPPNEVPSSAERRRRN